jgi:hypothetical protein
MLYKNRLIIIIFSFIIISFFIIPYFNVIAKTVCNPNTLKPVKYGQKGKDVKNLQACLIEAGYNIPTGANGYYGIQTKKAVKKFYSEWHKGRWTGNSIDAKGIAKLKEKLLSKTPEASIVPKEKKTEILDCGTSIDCFISAFITCTPAKVIHVATTDIFGIKQITKSFLEIKGKEKDKCVFYLRTEKIDLEFPTNTPQEIINKQKAVYKMFEGRDGVCKFNLNDLTTILKKWKAGNLYFSTEGGDFAKAECKGKFFEQFTPEESKKIEEIIYGKRIPANISIKIDSSKCPSEAILIPVEEDGTACYENQEDLGSVIGIEVNGKPVQCCIPKK